MAQVKVPVCVFAFDCLHVDGETLLKEPLEARRAHMAAALPSMQPGFVCLAKSHRLQAQKPGPRPDTQQDPNSAEVPPASTGLAQQADELHASSAGDAVTDLVSEDEDADMAAGEAAERAAQHVILSTLEKQAPGPEDIAISEGEPAAIR